jgi:hypothetical protein
MNSLLFFEDDGISDRVWEQRVLTHLKSGKTVLVIDDQLDDRYKGAIGTGDGLTGYDAEGMDRFANFELLSYSRKAPLEDKISKISERLMKADRNTVVCWNASILENQKFVREERYLEVQRLPLVDHFMEFCANAEFDSLYVAYGNPGLWSETEYAVYLPQLRTLNIQSMAAYNLRGRCDSDRTKNGLLTIAPLLEKGINQLFGHEKQRTHWETITPAGANQYHFQNFKEIRDNTGRYTFMFESL